MEMTQRMKTEYICNKRRSSDVDLSSLQRSVRLKLPLDLHRTSVQSQQSAISNQHTVSRVCQVVDIQLPSPSVGA